MYFNVLQCFKSHSTLETDLELFIVLLKLRSTSQRIALLVIGFVLRISRHWNYLLKVPRKFELTARSTSEQCVVEIQKQFHI